MGSFSYDPTDDYPQVSEKLGRVVSLSPRQKGVLLCGSGVGASAAVNKISGIRAAIGINFAADDTSSKSARQMVGAFLTTAYQKKERYERRINQIKKLETG